MMEHESMEHESMEHESMEHESTPVRAACVGEEEEEEGSKIQGLTP
jgi:hypothetical protein